jgi:pyruvate dehydrogenase E1 component alpha subunit
MGYAGLCRLPVLFVCENNRYATYSDQLKRQASDNICERVATFGVRATRIFGNDVAKVYRTLAHEVQRIRQGDGPALVEAYTYRWNSMSAPRMTGSTSMQPGEMRSGWTIAHPPASEKLVAAGSCQSELALRAGKKLRVFRFARRPFPGAGLEASTGPRRPRRQAPGDAVGRGVRSVPGGRPARSVLTASVRHTT